MPQRHAATSLWNGTTTQMQFPPLAGNVSADVAIIGAGITGLTAALALKRAGRRVAVLEQLPAIGDGMSGHTTAHLTEVLDTGLQRLVKVVGEDGARTVWQAGRLAIDHIQDTCRTENIDCDYTRVPGYLYAARETDLPRIQQETELAQKLGFTVDFSDDHPFPQMVHGAMRVPDQAQFHPGKYLQALANLIDGDGCRIFTSTHVTQVHHDRPIRIDAGAARITADHLIYATQQPIHDPLFTVKVPAYDTYAIAIRVPKGTYPYVLAWDTNDPYYYWRLNPGPDCDMLIIGGEDHRTGQVEDAEKQHAALIAYAGRCLGGITPNVAFKWQGQWLEPVDGVPFIGPSSKPHEYIATGYSGNGMTMGTYAGLLLTDQILGRAHPAGDIFDPGRLKWRGMGQLISENLVFPAHLAKDRLHHPQSTDPEKLAPGQGAVVRRGTHAIAVSRDDNGQLHTCSAVCTHMGCLVHFNAAQKLWECPCHGSIFKPDGSVVAGPATKPLKPGSL